MVPEASQTALWSACARYPTTRNSATSSNATPPSTTVVSKMAHLARQLVAGAIEDFEAPLRSGQIVSNDSISGILTTHYYANNPHRNYITNQHERSSHNNSSTQSSAGFDDADLDDLLRSISQESGLPCNSSLRSISELSDVQHDEKHNSLLGRAMPRVAHANGMQARGSGLGRSNNRIPLQTLH